MNEIRRIYLIYGAMLVALIGLLFPAPINVAISSYGVGLTTGLFVWSVVERWLTPRELAKKALEAEE